jgi:hypothetical protein
VYRFLGVGEVVMEMMGHIKEGWERSDGQQAQPYCPVLMHWSQALASFDTDVGKS